MSGTAIHRSEGIMGESLPALDQVKSTAIDLGMRFGPWVAVANGIPAAAVIAGGRLVRVERMQARPA